MSLPSPVDLASLCLDLQSRLQHVAVDREAIDRVGIQLAETPLLPPEWRHPAFPSEAGEALDAVVWLGNAINFSYWVGPSDTMWTVRVGERNEVDAFAAFGAIHNAIRDGVDLCDGATLAAYAHVIADSGIGLLPLRKARESFLRQVGTLLALEFGGCLDHAVMAAGDDAVEHAIWLARTFPSFRDSRRFHGATLHFMKRAQLAAGMLHAARVARGAPGLRHVEKLTVYADYMLPRALRELGVLVYSDRLAAHIDSGWEIEAGSDEETELRVATVAAGELLIAAAQDHGAAEVDCLRLDHWLWRRGLGAAHPHHRTRTTDY